MIKIALPKGRLGKNSAKLLENIGYEFNGLENPERKLVFSTEKNTAQCFLVKPFDVPVYVQLGAADIGICGKDILMERNSDVYQLADLKIGLCSMAVAGKSGFTDDTSKPLKVATEFPNITRNYFSSLSRAIKIITLRGSLELAPILGLSDVIVDIVETGATLRENNLKVIEVICPINAVLIANKSAYYFKEKEITKIMKGLSQ